MMRASIRLTRNAVPRVMRALAKEDERMAGDLARYVRDKAKHHAPVDTGNLRDRIRVEGTGSSRDVVSDTKDRSKPPLLWSTQRDYAYYVEYGSVWDPAHPYMAPAALEGKKHMRTIGQEMGRRIENIARSGTV